MPRRMLIVRADRNELELSRRFFLQCGYDVRIAKDGLRCMRQLRAQTPDIMLLDMQQLCWGGTNGGLALMLEDYDLMLVPTVLLGTQEPARLPVAVAPILFHKKPVQNAELLRSVQVACQCPV